LLSEGANVAAYDPVAIPIAKAIFGEKVQYLDSARECIAGADCCILMTEWPEFKKLSPEDFMAIMKEPVLIDGRRLYDAEVYRKKLNFIAIGLGANQV
jgi:UDPglucose 6-dehydrogenase